MEWNLALCEIEIQDWPHLSRVGLVVGAVAAAAMSFLVPVMVAAGNGMLLPFIYKNRGEEVSEQEDAKIC